MEDRLPRKLAAILYADVAGYSRLTGEDEDGTHRRLCEYLDLIGGAIEAHEGRVVHYAGDAVLADFGTVSEALSCATSIQGELATRNQNLPDERKVQFRIGVNLGEVIVSREGIYGDGVNVAARLESLADPGGICISESVRSAVGKKLNLGYEFMGEQKVKNIAEPVRAYRVVLDPHNRSKDPFPGRPALGLADQPSIAVLPFTNRSGDEDQEYFSDGITEDIIRELSRYSDLFVIAWDSSLVYKNKSARVQDIAKALGVRYLLEGSVRSRDNRVRVTARLIDASTQRHIWAERYDRDLDDIFAIQDEITHKIVVALQVKLTTGQVAEQWAGGTRSLEAWECMILGREHFYHYTAEENATARGLFQQALEIDPNYLMAGIFLAWTHWEDARFETSADPQLSLELAERQVAAIRATDKGQNMGGTVVASIHLLKGEYEKAVCAARSAMAFAPGPGDRAQLGFILLYAGEPAEAITELNTAIRLSPFHPSWYLSYLALAHLWNGDCSRAIEIGERHLIREPENVYGYADLALIYAIAGHDDEAKRTMTRLVGKFPTFRLGEYARTQLYKDPERKAQVLRHLREAGLPE